MTHSFAAYHPDPSLRREAPAAPWAAPLSPGLAPGLAPGPDARVWFVLDSAGLAGLRYPSLDRPLLAGMQLLPPGAGHWRPVDDGIPAYRWAGRGHTRRVVADPHHDALLIEGQGDVGQVFVAIAPAAGGAVLHPVSHGGHEAWLAGHGDACVAVVGSLPLTATPAGVAFTAAAAPWRLAVGCGADAASAVDVAIAALARPFEQAWADHLLGWQRRLAHLPLERLAAHAHDHGRLLRTSALVLLALEDKLHPGAMLAAWEPAEVRPRDTYHLATARLALGDEAAAARALAHLMRTQRPDGAWPNAMALDGRALDDGAPTQVAYPLLLAWQLRHLVDLQASGAWRMARAAALYLARHRPLRGSPHGRSLATLAAEVAAMACAAELAEAAGETVLAAYMRGLARTWRERLERASYAECPACIGRVHDGHAEDTGGRCRIDASLLALVRFGVRPATDPRLERSLAVIDAELREILPQAPVWRQRHLAGQPDGQGCPLLVGERGHLELAAGHERDAAHLLHAMERLTGEGGTLPELLQAPGAAALPGPSGWAHAEYAKLARSLADGRVFDHVAATAPALAATSAAPTAVWSFNDPITAVPAGRRLRLEAYAPAELRWSWDGWRTWGHVVLGEAAPGIWSWEPPGPLAAGDVLDFTFYWPQARRWEGRNFTLRAAEPTPHRREDRP